MRLEPFAMERMQSEWENRVRFNLSESGVNPLSVADLISPDEVEALLSSKLVYVQSNGTEELRARIAALYPGAGSSNVVVANGTAEANFIVAWHLVEPGDEVVMVLPNYMQLHGMIRSFSATIVGVSLQEELGWGLDVSALSRAVSPRTRLIVVCNPNNPTGAILSAAEMDGIVAAAAKHGSWLLADEVYRGAEREGAETPTFFGRYDRVLVTGGLSKAYGLPGLRVGWVVGPSRQMGELWGRKDYLTISPSALSDFLGQKALDRRPSILARTRRILQENYPLVEEWISGREGGFRLVPPRAGAIAYLRYERAWNSLELVERLKDECDVLIVPGDHFGMDGYLRVGFGNEPSELRGGLEAMGRFWDAQGRG